MAMTLEYIERCSTPEPTTGCWLWTGPLTTNRYGRAEIGGRKHRAHRLAFKLAFGGIPIGLWVLHHCDNRACVNPAHLYAGTPRQNALDMVARSATWRRPIAPRRERKPVPPPKLRVVKAGLAVARAGTPNGMCPFCLRPIPKHTKGRRRKICGEGCRRAYQAAYQKDRRARGRRAAAPFRSQDERDGFELMAVSP